MTTDALPDPKLLLLFEAMYRARSVTQAAEALVLPVQQALSRLRMIGGRAAAFDPAMAQRRFRLGMTDASHITLLPRLLVHVRKTAPRVLLEVGYIGTTTPRELESGAIDLAFGFLPNLDAGFHHQTLFMQDFVCLVGANHPRIRRALTLRQFEDEAHVGLSLEGTGHAIVGRSIERQRLRRGEALRLPGFLGLAAIVSTTDLVATVPRQIGEALVGNGSIRLFECPVRIAPYAVKQHWHARFHHDPGNRWLREVCAMLFTDAMAPGRRAGRPAAARAGR